MGYCIEQRGAKFTILAKNKPKALEALKAIAGNTDNMGGGSSSGEKWYSWVNMGYVSRATLEKAIEDWRWHAETNEEGDINDIWFDGQKIGDEDHFFAALAPFVEKGSYVEMQGEEGEIWRYAFNGKSMTELTPETTWPKF